MVDRYLLPVPKAKMLNMYKRFKNKPLHALPYVFSILLLSLQVNRILAMRMQGSKPANYYMDWGNKDAPGKVRYFSSQV